MKVVTLSSQKKEKYMKPSRRLHLMTDEKGHVKVTTGAADTYPVRAEFYERGERKEGQYDLSSYEATYVFQVFNRLWP